MSEYKVYVKVGDVTYRGRRSVNQRGDRVYIDGRQVGVECDNDGNPLANVVLIAAPLPVARVVRASRSRRAWWWMLSILRRKAT